MLQGIDMEIFNYADDLGKNALYRLNLYPAPIFLFIPDAQPCFLMKASLTITWLLSEGISFEKITSFYQFDLHGRNKIGIDDKAMRQVAPFVNALHSFPRCIPSCQYCYCQWDYPQRQQLVTVGFCNNAERSASHIVSYRSGIEVKGEHLFFIETKVCGKHIVQLIINYQGSGDHYNRYGKLKQHERFSEKRLTFYIAQLIL